MNIFVYLKIIYIKNIYIINIYAFKSYLEPYYNWIFKTEQTRSSLPFIKGDNLYLLDNCMI